MLPSQNNMIDISQKIETKRRAIAQGRLYAKADTLEKIRTRSLPKGDALIIAQVAGITTAKRTAELLPFCHPLPLDYVRVQCDVNDQFVLATCEVSAFAKTGVEMEALQVSTKDSPFPIFLLF
jgi:cyclic pyranopterin monophosphate synthase